MTTPQPTAPEHNAQRPRARRGAATINDVAAHAGVAPMTVSRVINRVEGVRPATRAKVEASIAALGYAPSAAARELAGADPTRIALVYANPSYAWLSELLMGSLDGARTLQVQLTVEPCEDADSIQQLVAHLRDGRVNGVLLPSPLGENRPMLAALEAAGLPAVAIASADTDAGCASVCIDDFAAARAMTRHLIALGHRRIAFIKGSPDQTASERRFMGYAEALAEAGLPLLPELIAEGRFTYRSGLEAAVGLLSLAQLPTAIFASNDDMAAGAISQAHARQLDVPRDLTVCGFDDTPIATAIWPELTTIRQPVADMARTALSLLAEGIRSGGGHSAPEPRIMDYQLVCRASDGPPPD